MLSGELADSASATSPSCNHRSIMPAPDPAGIAADAEHTSAAFSAPSPGRLATPLEVVDHSICRARQAVAQWVSEGCGPGEAGRTGLPATRAKRFVNCAKGIVAQAQPYLLSSAGCAESTCKLDLATAAPGRVATSTGVCGGPAQRSRPRHGQPREQQHPDLHRTAHGDRPERIGR